MSDYSRSIDLATAPDDTFAFVSDVSNLPRYVPTTRSAEETAHGRVHVEGESHGEHYANDGHLYIDQDRRLMRWGSGATAYRGELTVDEAGAGSRVALKLHFNEDMGHAPAPAEIEKSLTESLERLKASLA